MSRLMFFTIFVFGALLVCIMLPACFFMPDQQESNISDIQSGNGGSDRSGIEDSEGENDLSDIGSTPNDDSSPIPQESDRFSKIIFIKLCDVSDEPNYESVYRFSPDGTVKYSVNMYEGFFQDDAKYYLKKGGNGNLCEVYGYQSGKRDEATLIFTICDDNKVFSPTEAPASFIKNDEFERIYKFHADWNSGLDD